LTRPRSGTTRAATPELPKGEVNVDVENGVAVLRGQVQPPELIEDLVQWVRR
jgi:hypothetical protein